MFIDKEKVRKYINTHYKEWLENYSGKVVCINSIFCNSEILSKKEASLRRKKEQKKVTDIRAVYINIPSKLNPIYWIKKSREKRISRLEKEKESLLRILEKELIHF